MLFHLIISWCALFSNFLSATHIHREDVHLEDKEAKAFLIAPRRSGRYRRVWLEIGNVASSGLAEECREVCRYSEVARHVKGSKEVLEYMKDYKCKHQVETCPHGQVCVATNEDTSSIKKLLVECSGSAISYQCDTGYVLEGIGSSLCIEESPDNLKGKWADPKPECKAITCEPPSLLYGQVSTPKPALFGTIVSYQCDAGFVLEGKGNSTCVEDGLNNVKGKWADPAPVCTAITCAAPSLINGKVTVPKPAPLGSAISYQCDTGYVLEGIGSSLCIEESPDNLKGKWADPKPECKAITCESISLLNGQVFAPKPALFGTVVSYQCDTGFVLQGKGNSTCVEDGLNNVKGKWADRAPVCTAITCTAPSLINGKVTVPKPAPLGSAISYQCDTGYVLEGIGSSTCVVESPDNLKGKWADPKPECKAITCEPPSLLYGQASTSKPALFGTVVSYQCDADFVLQGKGNSTCVEDGFDNVKGKWADPAPICTAITCEQPSLLNGQVSVTKPDAPVGSGVSFQCDTGFVLEGKARSTCVRNGPDNVKGKWADLTPICTAITCEPPQLLNGQVSVVKPALFGTVAIFRCDRGFVLEGNNSSKCVQNGPDNVTGKWVEQVPLCKALTCEPPVLTDGQASVVKPATYGTVVTYICNKGFVLEGEDSSTCVENGPGDIEGKWADPVPVCRVITCELPQLKNGKVSVVKPTIYGTVVTYSCDTGFILEGKQNSSCVENGPNDIKGKWEGPLPVCRVITCETPQLTNGKVSVGAPPTYGSTINYSCNEGFVLDGKENSTCVENGVGNIQGQWADPAPVCRIITCDEPQLLNGQVSVATPAVYGSVVTYHCDTGFVLEGQESTTCVENGPDNIKGKWKDAPPLCIAITCETPVLLNGQVSVGELSTHGTTVNYHCNVGYILRGSASSTCGHDGPDNAKGKWSKAAPVCLAITCEPPVVPNGQSSVTKPAIYGAHVNYKCKEGFAMEGKENSTCAEDGPNNVKGKWADPTPVCTLITCEPPRLLNGQVSVTKPSPYGSTVNYRCDKGLVLEGDKSTTCVGNGTDSVVGKWAAPLPVCKAITCKPPALLNGQVSVATPAIYGTVVNYRCDKGFVLDGKESSTCMENGTDSTEGKWAELTPVCKEITCEPPRLVNGKVSIVNPAVYGSTARFRCDIGFVLEGRDISTCVDDGLDNAKGKWTDLTPKCIAITCETPHLLNGHVSVGSLSTHGTKVNYRCNEGFVLEGSATSTCVHDDSNNAKGTWSDATPVCSAITCQPPTIANGQASVTTPSNYGSSVTYSCDEGFILVGKRNSTCVGDGPSNVNGKWADPTPACRVITCEPPAVQNGQASVTKPATYGTIVNYKCNEGFVLEGRSNSSCDENEPDNVKGKWADPLPMCKAITCEPPVLPNGHVSVTKPAMYGSTVTYRCNRGFVLDGKGRAECVQNGTDNISGKWTDETPLCKAITCETPHLLNGQVTAGELSTHGTAVNFRCDEGFILEGKTTSTCVHEDPNSATGNWSQPPPVCKAVTCEEPSLKNGNVTTEVRPATFGSAVKYTCNEGFVLDGTFNATCTQNGTENMKGEWSEPLPICKEITCDQPVLVHGAASTSSLQYGSTVTYSCEENFFLVGKAKSTCVQDGKTSISGVWADPVPICKDIEIKSPASTIGYVHGDFGERTDTRGISETAINIGIGIGCGIVVLVLVSVAVFLVIKKNRMAKIEGSPLHEPLEEESPPKASAKDFQNPLYNMEEWDDGNTVQSENTFHTFGLDLA